MKRKTFSKRKDFEAINDSLGFDFQVVEEKQYWIEDVGYEFSEKEIEKIEKATNELHQMCFDAIDYVIKNNLFHKFNISEKLIPYIKKSWENEDWSLYGRFDFFFDGKKLKVFEYNADTPTSLLEASLAQYEWKEGQRLPDQFNSIDEKMIAWWELYKEEKDPDKVYFTTVKENHEDFRNTEYIMDTAHRAGLETDFIFLEDIGSDGEYLYDLNNEPIEHLFKLYPWEWLAQEEFIDTILCNNCEIIEPVWKMLLSNKALMAILWELYPNHEYLLPTYFSPEKLGSNYVKKPILSREGQNVEIISENNISEKKEGLYESEHNIYQEVCTLPLIDGYYPVIGSWVIGEESAGMGIREDQSKITANLSRFVPHYFVSNESIAEKADKGQSVSEFFSNNGKTKDKILENLDELNSNNKKMNDLLEKSQEIINKRKTVAVGESNSFDLFKKNEIIKNIKKQSINEVVMKSGDTIRAVGVMIIVVGLIMLGGYGIMKENNEAESFNQQANLHNKNQKDFLSSLFSDQKRDENLQWIKTNVDEKNQPVFNKFVESMREMIVNGSHDESKFYEIDKKLSNSVFCIQGEKDINTFDTFQNRLFETEKEKEYLIALKKQFKYQDKKMEIPSKEELLEICDFKDFEKDFEKVNQEENNKETDPNKKVILEAEQQNSSEDN